MQSEPDVTARPTEATFPLRADQRGMWLMEQLNPSTTLFGLGFALRFRGPYRQQRVIDALTEIMGDHAALRAKIGIVDGQPVHVVAPIVEPSVVFEPAPGWDREQLRARADRFVVEPFDLRRGPLVRFLVLEIAADDVLLVIATHHMISDLWSLTAIGAAIVNVYGSEPLDDRKLSRQRSYADFIAAEHEFLGSDRGRESLAFWKHELGGAPSTIDLAPLAPPAELSGFGTPYLKHVQPETVQRWDKAARAAGTRLEDAVMAGFLGLIHRYTGQDNITVSTYRANRSARDFAAIGCYRNIVPLPYQIEPGISFGGLLDLVSEVDERSKPHRRVSFPAAFQEMQHAGQPDIALPVAFQWFKSARRVDPRFVSAFGLGGEDSTEDLAVSLGDVTMEPVAVTRHIDVDLTLEAHHNGDELTLVFLYDGERLSGQLVTRMADHFVRLVDAGIDELDRSVAQLPMQDESTIADLRASWRPTSADAVPSVPLIELVDRSIDRRPDEVLYREGDRSLTAAELSATADRMAAGLRAAGVKRGDRVGLHLALGIDVPPLLLGVLRLGATYVALEPQLPEQRLQMLAEDAEIGLVISTVPELSDVTAGNASITWMQLDEVAASGAAAIDGASPPERVELAMEDIVYVSFTSGSTGRPKPVGVTNANALNYLTAVQSRPGFGPGDVILAFTGLGFDLTLTELFLPLLADGSAVIVGPQAASRPMALAEAIKDGGVTLIQTTPARWRKILGTGFAPDPKLRAWCGGEHLVPDLAAQLLAVAGEVWNVYGPTETTVWCSAGRVEPGKRASIGAPLDNVTFSIVGPGGRPQPVGAVGELILGGAGVAPGYIGRPEETAAAFIPDPDDPTRLAYRTGDLVVQDDDGLVYFLGRADTQIKLNGRRIEPGEIESTLVTHDAVKAAAVVLRDEQLVAFVVGDDGPAVTDSDLRRYLTEYLPIALVPARIEFLDSLPLTSTAKVDRRALEARRLTSVAKAYEAPELGLEEVLAGLWTDALEVERVGRHDDFFELGGTSLQAATIFAEISDLTGRDYPLSALFLGPTIAELAQVVGSDWTPPWTSVVPVQPKGTKRPFFSVSPFVVSTLSYRLLADSLGPDQPLYAIQPQGLDSDAPVHTSIDEMAEHYIAEMRAVQEHGPYRLGGHCAGNFVAFEMGIKLQAMGEEVETLILVDWGPPGDHRRPPRELKTMLSVLRSYWKAGQLWDSIAWQAGLVTRQIRGLWSQRAHDRRKARVQKQHWSAYGRYDPTTKFVGDVIFLRATESIGRKDRDWHLRWQDLVDGSLEVREIPGDHAELLVVPESTRFMADQLRDLFAGVSA